MIKSRLGRIIQPAEGQWAQFKQSRSDVSIFHHHVWSKLLSQFYGFSSFVIVTEDSKGEISAGIPMMEISHPLTGKSWKALPFSDQCTQFYRDTISLEQLSELLIALYEESNARRMEVRTDLSLNSKFHLTSTYVIHKLSLNPDVESVKAKIHRMHARNIEIAEKNKVEVRMRSDLAGLKEFYGLHLENRRRQGVPVQPWGFFVSIQRNLIDKDLGFLLNAYSAGKCISAALFLFWGNTLTYKFGASSSDGRKLRANNPLFWRAIRWGCENGYSVLDLGRTAKFNQGLKEFKSRWGATEVPLAYSHFPKSPQRGSNRIFVGLTNTLIRNSPIWVCRFMGEVLYWYLG